MDYINYKINIPYKNKKIFIIYYEDTKNNIYFSKIIKYSLTKEYNELLTEEYNKYQIISKYNFEKFNQIINLDNVVFDSNIDLNIINNDISYPITLNTSLLNIYKNDVNYYSDDNISEDEDSENKINKYKKIRYNLKSIKYTIKKMCFIICDYNYEKIRFDNYIYKKNKNFENELLAIKKILDNIVTLYEEEKFIHGDLKCDNILLLKDITPYFFDLEFSLFCNEDTIKIISHCKPRINLYLNLNPNFILKKDFLHFFDYYLFTITIIAYHNELKKNNIFISLLDKYLYNNNDENLILFLYFYDKINYYFKENNIVITINTMLDYSSYNNIYKILNYSYNTSLSYIEEKIKFMYIEIYNMNL
jgi:hypothetical protein